VKRSFGISLTAIFCGVGALLGLLFAVLGVGSLLLNSRALPPASGGVVGLVMVGTMAIAFMGWAIATMVGLWRLRSWARWSVLIYAGFLLFVALSSGAMMAVIPLPAVPNAPDGMMQGMRFGLVGFYLVLAALAAGWLVYFSRDSVKMQFSDANLPAASSRRPLSISIIGYLLVSFAVFGLVSVFMPMPAFVLGLTIDGFPARLIYAAWCACYAIIGYALLRLRAGGRIAGMTLFTFMIVNSLAVLPTYGELTTKMMRDLQDNSNPNSAQLAGMFTNGWFAAIMVVFGCVTSAIPIWFLAKHRRAFESQAPMHE
jgi:hypothetical protein